MTWSRPLVGLFPRRNCRSVDPVDRPVRGHTIALPDQRGQCGQPVDSAQYLVAHDAGLDLSRPAHDAPEPASRPRSRRQNALATARWSHPCTGISPPGCRSLQTTIVLSAIPACSMASRTWPVRIVELVKRVRIDATLGLAGEIRMVDQGRVHLRETDVGEERLARPGLLLDEVDGTGSRSARRAAAGSRGRSRRPPSPVIRRRLPISWGSGTRTRRTGGTS